MPPAESSSHVPSQAAIPAIRRAAVIGAGTMGAAIAAHLVNAGVPTLLLDIPKKDVADFAERDQIVEAGVERALKARPPAFMDPEQTSALLTLGNTEDNLGRLADVDWIVEAIVEKPEAKRALWQAVEAVAGPGTIFSSNSSGIPMTVQSEGRSDSFRRRFLGAHFYNPPRYLYLLELIPTGETAPEVLEAVRAFGDRVLGKGIVLANDVPGFIGNRIGIYSLLQTARTAEEMGLGAEVVDALTGPVLGRPRSGTMRLADTVGLDVLGLISKDLTAATTDDFRLPGVMQRLLDVYWNRPQSEGTQENSNDAPFSLNSLGAAGMGGSPSFANPFQDIAGTPGASYPTNPFPYTVPKPGPNVSFSSLYPLEMDNLTSEFDVPYTYNFNLNVQRALPSNMVLTVGYVGSLGRKLMRAGDGNRTTQAGHDACLSGTGTGAPIVLGNNTFSCVQLANAQSLYFPGNKTQPAVVPGSQIPGLFPNGLPYYLSIGGMYTNGASSYNSLQVSLAKTPTRGLYFALAYTYSHALDNASGLEDSVANGYGSNYVPGFEHLSYGDSAYDARHRFVGLYNYEIPVPHAMTGNPGARWALAGWHLSGVTALQAGFPVTIYDAGVYNSLYCDQFSFVNCPDVPNTSTFHIKTLNPRHAGNYWFNPATFSQEPIGTFGNVKRNFFHGPGFNYSNIEIYKNLPVGGADSRQYIQLRLEAYNAFNHANFANPNGNFGAGSPAFGSINSVDQPVSTSGDPQPGRAIQLAGKFYF